MKWKKDHKIPNTKSKLTEAAIAKATMKGSMKNKGFADNLDDSNIEYEYDEDDEDEEDDDDEDQMREGGHAFGKRYKSNGNEDDEEDEDDDDEDQVNNRSNTNNTPQQQQQQLHQSKQASYNPMNMKPLMI